MLARELGPGFAAVDALIDPGLEQVEERPEAATPKQLQRARDARQLAAQAKQIETLQRENNRLGRELLETRQKVAVALESAKNLEIELRNKNERWVAAMQRNYSGG